MYEISVPVEPATLACRSYWRDLAGAEPVLAPEDLLEPNDRRRAMAAANHTKAVILREPREPTRR